MLRVSLSVFALAICLAGGVVAQGPAPRPEAPAVKPAVLVNLNTATVAELEALPGIGAKVAGALSSTEPRRGPFVRWRN